MVDELTGTFIDGLAKLGVPDRYTEQFVRYREELLAWNTRVNLTAITDPEEVLTKHFLDSLSLLLAYDQPQARLLDIGSGAGFPGLALKIVRPAWRVTLLEATNKKVLFLRHMVDVLHLENIEVVHGRAEELGHTRGYRAAFDLVTARAVSALPALLEYCAPYCRVNGRIVLPKKGELVTELVQGKRAGAQVHTVFEADMPVELPGLADGRRLLVWRQRELCPAQYPRSGAVMAKKPLGGAVLK